MGPEMATFENGCVLPKTSPLLKEDQYSINRIYMPARASKCVFCMYVCARMRASVCFLVCLSLLIWVKTVLSELNLILAI